MIRLLTIDLHGGGNIAMQADCPEETAAFDGLGELLHLPVKDGCENAGDAQLILPEAMPEGRHTLKTISQTEIAYAADWSRVLIAGWKEPPQRPQFYQRWMWQTLLLFAGMNAILRGEKAALAHCAVL